MSDLLQLLGIEKIEFSVSFLINEFPRAAPYFLLAKQV